MIKNMLKTGLFLFIFSAISGVLLSYCEQLTSPVIAKANSEKEAKARSEVLPEAGRFSEKAYNSQTISNAKYYIGFDKKDNDKPIGMVVNTKPKGYGKEINMLVGINSSGRVTGVKILDQSETPGLGAKVVQEEFQSKFEKLLKENENPNFYIKKDVSKENGKNGDVDAVTAATITSRAFCQGIRDAIQIFKTTSIGGTK